MKKIELLKKVLNFLYKFKPESKIGGLKLVVFSYIALRSVQQFLRINGLYFKKSVKGQHVVITGSGSGIGREMALMLGHRGAKISIWDVNL